jgi:hypothetical protein
METRGGGWQKPSYDRILYQLVSSGFTVCNFSQHITQGSSTEFDVTIYVRQNHGHVCMYLQVAWLIPHGL